LIVRTRRFHPAAFTLVELLVVIFVIAVLIAITLPALRGARVSSQRLQSLSNLRQCAVTFETYVGASGAYPFGTGALVCPTPGWCFGLQFEAWAIERHWNVFVQDIAPWREHYRVWLSPGADPERFEALWREDDPVGISNGAIPSYRYSTTFIASPRVWTSGYEPAASDIRAISPSEVLFPSNKVLLSDEETTYEQGDRASLSRRPVLFADSSAALRSDNDAAPPVQNPLSSRHPKRFQDTPDGVHGRDFSVR